MGRQTCLCYLIERAETEFQRLGVVIRGTVRNHDCAPGPKGVTSGQRCVKVRIKRLP